MKKSFLKSLLHPVCLVGGVIAIAGFGASLVALAIDLVESEPHPYQGLLTFVLYPSVMFLGLGVVLFGLRLERRRSRKLEDSHAAWRPALDPGLKKDRRIIGALVIFAGLFLTASIMGALRAYHYSESNTFCGEVCHTPMGPQFVTHQNSPHAQIHCVACHVGPGAQGYIAAKVNGTRQLYQVLVGNFTRPIRAHPESVPGSEESCEHCHWRQKFWGERLDRHVRFGYDLKNTRRAVRLVYDVGGGHSSYGPRQGIHWHANAENQVWFRAADDFLQEIHRVKVRRADGTTRVYERSREDGEAPELHDEQLMTCRDCHNRPAHRIAVPSEAVDLALEVGKIESSLPFIKKVAVAALSQQYSNVDEAMDGIRAHVEGFYRDNFGGAVLARKDAVDSSIETLQSVYRRNVFPDMGVDGYTYPDNSGHRNFPGCLRCHDGELVSEDGTVLENDCNLCHRMVTRSTQTGAVAEVPVSLSLLHPWKSEEKHSEVDCWTCHSGNASPYAECDECHANAAEGHPMAFECSMCHKPERPEVVGTSCSPCHPMGGSPQHQHPDHRECLKCHAAHSWKVAYPDACGGCHERVQEKPLSEHYPGEPCSPCHKFNGVVSHFYGLPAGTEK